MNGRLAVVLGVLVAALVVITQTFFVVRQNEFAIVLQFRDIVRTETEPGLKVKIPFINQVQKFERRVMTRNYPAEQFLTSEGKILRINFFVKWRISDVRRFYISTYGTSEDIAAQRLGEIVKDGLKGVIAGRTLQQVVTADRKEFLDEVLKIAGANVASLGMTMVDVRVKSIELPEDVSDTVFNRMRQDFFRQAAQLRAEGAAVSEQTRAEADRQRTEILANAYRDAEKIRGEGDAAAADIYANAYGRNPEFYSFYRGLQAYRRSLGKQGDVLVIAPDGEFFKYLKDSGRK
jgi:membrane protease subunit HflC